MHLVVCGHLRNFLEKHELFISSYFSRLNAETKHLFTYRNMGWWSAVNSVTEGEDIDFREIIKDDYFDTISLLKSELVSSVSNLYLPPVSKKRPYLRKENMAKQFALRYLSCRATGSLIPPDSTVVLTRPDLLPSEHTFQTIMKMIETVNTNRASVCYMSEPPQDQGDYVFVGSLINLTRIMSPSAINQNEDMDVHDFLGGAVRNTDIQLVGFEGMGWQLCNSPQMMKYTEAK